jgi:hypothetical protein
MASPRKNGPLCGMRSLKKWDLTSNRKNTSLFNHPPSRRRRGGIIGTASIVISRIIIRGVIIRSIIIRRIIIRPVIMIVVIIAGIGSIIRSGITIIQEEACPGGVTG